MDLDAVIEAVRQRTSADADNNHPTMRLTQTEKARSLEIKAAVEKDPRVRNLCDFEYVHYALVTRAESMEKICQRVYLTQCFREEYRIDNDAMQGIQMFNEASLNQPGLFLAVEYLPSTENYILISDWAPFTPSNLKTDEQMQNFLGAFYYLWQAMYCNFRSIRNGNSSMVDCMGISYSNLDLAFMEKFVVDLMSHYPVKMREQFFVNSDSIANMCCALWKRFLPKEVMKGFQLGYQIGGMEGQKLNVLYSSPTPEKARERMLLKVLELLSIRYQNEKNFSLDNAVMID